jgi:hypothetical protein
LHIRRVRATCDQARLASYHTVPNASRALIFAIAGTQQIATELPVQRGVDLGDDFAHAGCSFRSQNRARHILARESEKQSENALCA